MHRGLGSCPLLFVEENHLRFEHIGQDAGDCNFTEEHLHDGVFAVPGEPHTNLVADGKVVYEHPRRLTKQREGCFILSD